MVSQALRRRGSLGGWFVGIGLLCAAALPARVEAQSLAVLGLTSDEGDDGLATAITRAVRSEAESDDRYEVNSSHVSLAQMTMAQDCEISDAQCRIAVAGALKVDRVVYGSVHRANKRTYAVELHMANGRDGTEARASRSFSTRDQSDAAYARVARELFAELRGEEPAREETEASPTPVATVAPHVAPIDENPNAERPAPVRQDTAPSSNDWIGYTLIGVAVVATAMTAFSWMQIDKAEQDPGLTKYRGAVDPGADTCDEAKRGSTYGVGTDVLEDARAACRQGSTFEVLQYVFLTTAIASAGVGAYFLLDDESPSEAAAGRHAFALIPRVTTHDAAVSMRLRF